MCCVHCYKVSTRQCLSCIWYTWVMEVMDGSLKSVWVLVLQILVIVYNSQWLRFFPLIEVHKVVLGFLFQNWKQLTTHSLRPRNRDAILGRVINCLRKESIRLKSWDQYILTQQTAWPDKMLQIFLSRDLMEQCQWLLTHVYTSIHGIVVPHT